MGMAVHIDRPPHSAQLVAWGRAGEGWWGCITWRQRLRGPDGDVRELDFAAWVPATSITRPGWASQEELPRIDLPNDRRAWPAPPGWPAWYAGVWPHGPVNTPAGLEPVTGPAWRERRRR